MFTGPPLPHKLHEAAMATSPDGGGVILFGGYSRDSEPSQQDTILELRYGSDSWTILPQKLERTRDSHVVITIS